MNMTSEQFEKIARTIDILQSSAWGFMYYRNKNLYGKKDFPCSNEEIEEALHILRLFTEVDLPDKILKELDKSEHLLYDETFENNKKL